MAPSSTDLLESRLLCSQPEQQQDEAAVVGNLPRQHNTQLLHIDPSTLPAAVAPDAASAKSILTAATAPSLERSCCPHLYYSLPQQQQRQQHSAACSSHAALQEAAELLRSGEPVAIPTETVYGLAANALSAAAVSAVFTAKGRPSDNPLIVHISDLDMLAQLYPQQQQQQDTRVPQVPQQHSSSSSSGETSSEASHHSLYFIPQQYRRLIAAFWPGPLTLLLPATPLIPAAVTAGLPTVAVRMPAHPVARALIAAAGVPLAAPSANTSGRPSPTTAQHVMQVGR
jgi:tRNA A37 threonylcarbamoyladenosine synthetase subunit TsaC/SUA5/YrdC